MSALSTAGAAPADTPSYPVNLRVVGRRCLVVGGGRVAARKIGGLVAAGADITVVAPRIEPEVAELVATGDSIVVHRRPYQRGEVASYRLAITCTDDPTVNAQVYRDGESAGVWVNSADDPDNCAFTLPAVSRRGSLSLAVSTDGSSPAVASWIRRRLDHEYDERYLTLIALAAQIRVETRAVHGTTEVSGWIDALDDDLLDLIAGGDLNGARHRLRTALDLPTPVPSEPSGSEPFSSESQGRPRQTGNL